MSVDSAPAYTVAAGAGFAGDRIDPAVALAASGQVDAVVLECLAERTLVPALAARQANPEAGADPRLRRRLAPLLPVALPRRCRIISNLGAANPAAAGRAIAALAGKLGCRGARVAAIEGDDVMALGGHIAWEDPVQGVLLGAHAYLGAEALHDAVAGGADVVVTGRVADSGLFAAALLPSLDGSDAALAGALTVGHLLECTGQLTGGNFQPPDGPGLPASDLARLAYPLARVMRDGSAELTILDGEPGIVDAMTCTLQLLYEVHDPAAYITPDAIVDFSGVRFEEVGRNRVRMTGARHAGRPTHLKVAGFVEARGVIADVEIGFAGTGAQERAQRAADTLCLRLGDWRAEDIRVDLVGVNTMLGGASIPLVGSLPEVRVHVSARCADNEEAQVVEDEVYALTLSGPSAGGGVRSERRRRIEVVSGLIPRELVATRTIWTEAP